MVGKASFGAAGEVQEVDVRVVVVGLDEGEIVAVRGEGRGAADAVSLCDDAAAAADVLDDNLCVVVGVGDEGDRLTVRRPGGREDGFVGAVDFAAVGAIDVGDEERVAARAFGAALFEDVGQLGAEDAAFAGEAVEYPVGGLVRELARVGVMQVFVGELVGAIDVVQDELSGVSALHHAHDDVVGARLFPGGVLECRR